MKPYQEGKAAARWHLWCCLDAMLSKYPMTGKPDKRSSFKNGWYDEAFRVQHEMAKRGLR